MPAQDKSDLFEFMLGRVKETQNQHLDGEQALFRQSILQKSFKRELVETP